MNEGHDVTIMQNDGEARVIGKVYPSEGVFRAERKACQHKLWKHGGYALDEKALEKFRKNGIKEIIFRVEEAGTIYKYKTTVQTMNDEGQKIHYPPHRPQVVLSDEHWDISEVMTAPEPENEGQMGFEFAD